MEKEKLPYKKLKKGYSINFDKIEDGFLASGQFCYAETRNKARAILFDKIKYDDWELKYTHEPVTYLNIPIERSPGFDLYEFEGEEKTHFQITEILVERDRQKDLDNLLNSDVEYFYIIKNGLYYAPNHCGYTQYPYKAGVYDKEDAISSARSCREISLLPINVEEHNKLINEELLKLRKNIIYNER